MKLEELFDQLVPEKPKTVEGEVVEQDDEEFTSEEDLSNAISMLDDAKKLLDLIAEWQQMVPITTYHKKRARDLAQEIAAFLDTFDA